MQIKKIDPDDLTILLWLVEIEKICFPDSAWNKEQILSQIKTHESFVLFDQEIPRSYLFPLVNPWEIEILRVATDPDYRNKSYAFSILKYFIDNHNSCPCFLEVAQNNKNAIKLYESLGFQLVDKRKGYYHDGIDALIYCRKGMN
ncbi:GNAT family N-acetyltransferase [Leptospira sp. GIMC2001]|uniref:GNAT family N-acetyltransferase n=1 Tax=Leptospira sp. GIMC2001 TaxID=1513297 RepID=UPI00234B05CC|nr:GNAT family N-acetyltransferase [Leptospira sp. GIMC2001]WCL49881.1 GNAT family N-acetyltransferase [Leptospira sp. GIMC2001]